MRELNHYSLIWKIIFASVKGMETLVKMMFFVLAPAVIAIAGGDIDSYGCRASAGYVWWVMSGAMTQTFNAVFESGKRCVIQSSPNLLIDQRSCQGPYTAPPPSNSRDSRNIFNIY